MAEVQISRHEDYGVATVMARKGIDAGRIGKALGLVAPTSPSRSTGPDGLALIGTAPGTWLAMREAADPFWADDLRARLAGLASVSDQSGAYLVYRLTGPGTRPLLQRGLSIDLNPDVFAPHNTATTAIAHIGAIVWAMEEMSCHLAVYRSFAESFEHWLNAGKTAMRSS